MMSLLCSMEVAILGLALVTAEEHITPRSCGGPAPWPQTCRKAPGPGEERAPPGTPNVHCETTKGPITIEMHPEWAPLGAKRFLEAIADGVYDGTCIYRVVKNEAVQFGFPKDPELRKKWWSKGTIKDDAQIFQNPNFHKGMISFAGGGHNSRGLDVFITFMTGNANGSPRAPWETPFGILDEESLKHVMSFTSEYGEMPSFGGMGPDLSRGYDSLKKTHPNIDYFGKCTLVYPEDAPPIGKHPVKDSHMGQAYSDKRVKREQNDRPSFLNKQVPSADGTGDWVLSIRFASGSSLDIPVVAIGVLAAMAVCFRLALPKLSKVLWRKVTRCDL